MLVFLGWAACVPALAQQARPSATAVPVSVTKAKRQDVPVWLRGIGTVQALNTVVVRARVDGTLMQVPVTEGQLVKKGALLAVIDPRPYQASLDQAQAKKGADQAQLGNAKLDLQRYASLAQSSFASRQQVDTQTMQVAQLTASLKGDDAAIETAQLNLSFCYITAPFDGRIGLRQLDPGNIVRATDLAGIMMITQVRPIAVVFTLPQRQLPEIVEAMGKGTLPVTAWSNDEHEQLSEGSLLTPDNMIDPATGTVKLKATFANENDRLWPGQFVEARVLVRTEPQVVTVPSQAVLHGMANLYVYMVKPDSTVLRQSVEAVDRGDVMVITKGLQAGQEIVLDGQSRLDNGMLITAMTPSAPASASPAQTGG
ncbi:MAG TPA: efflux RND transporter periplasmic adaptor subunit [Acetobacteraceae bacterium]|nr:efflux RND transporter periplasmic adaptor subunit [Acetobacteraceae bacterium]